MKAGKSYSEEHLISFKSFLIVHFHQVKTNIEIKTISKDLDDSENMSDLLSLLFVCLFVCLDVYKVKQCTLTLWLIKAFNAKNEFCIGYLK